MKSVAALSLCPLARSLAEAIHRSRPGRARALLNKLVDDGEPVMLRSVVECEWLDRINNAYEWVLRAEGRPGEHHVPGKSIEQWRLDARAGAAELETLAFEVAEMEARAEADAAAEGEALARRAALVESRRRRKPSAS